MRGSSPYRHSVWFDVAGIVFFLALMVVAVAYVGMELTGDMGSVAGTGEPKLAGRGGPSPGRMVPRSSFSDRRGSRRGSLFGSRRSDESVSSRGPSRSSVPFSDAWRAHATPSLSDGTGTPRGTAAKGGQLAGTASPPLVPHERSRQSSRSDGFSQRTSRPAASAQSSWRSEARQFAGRMRALSGALGDVSRTDRSETKGTQRSASREASSSRSADSPPTPGRPTVPIDDHLHWLLAAGVLWGTWRLCGG